jgi:hypothetical protein
MSVEYHAYAGPFVVCRNEKVEVERKIRCCSNESCPKYQSRQWKTEIQFCPTCGTEIGEMTKKEDGLRVASFDLLEEIQNRLGPANWEYGFKQFAEEAAALEVWVTNDRGLGKHFDARRECYAVEFEPEAIQGVQAFKEQYAEPLAKLIEAYGEENVEIKWGFLGWLS